MFFAPPRIIETQVFARLPAPLQDADQSNEWVAGQPLGTHAGSLIEGPSFDREGNLWCVDVQNGRVFTVDRDGRFTVRAHYDGWPNGLKIHRDGRILITDYKHGLMVLDRDTGKVTPWLERCNAERFKGVNDLCIAANGDLYFTDQGLTGLHDPTGRVFRVRPDGGITCLLDNVPSPNGVALSPDEHVLYLAVTRGNQVWRVPLLEDGSVSKVSAFFTSHGPSGPDGLAVDDSGRVLVANPGLGCVWVLNARAEPDLVLRSCAGTSLTNVAFGGPDRQTLYGTDSSTGTVLRAVLDRAGLPLHRARR